MIITERQLRRIIYEKTDRDLSEIMNSVKKFIFEEDIVDYISEAWEEKSDAIVEKIAKSGINRDAEEFAAGAAEGDDDFENGREYKPDTPMRYEVFFQEDPDYVMGYKWGYQNGKTWDGGIVPADVIDQFILDQIEQYKLQAKTEITKDVLYTLYDTIAPNRIARKAWYAIKDAYYEGGIKNAITKGVPIALTIAIVETLDQAIIPLLCLKFGIPPVTNFVGLGEMIYPVVMPMFSSKEEVDFVKDYQTRTGDEELMETTKMKITRRQLRKIIREGGWEMSEDMVFMRDDIIDLASREQGVSLQEIEEMFGDIGIDIMFGAEEEGLVWLDTQRDIVYGSGARELSAGPGGTRSYIGENKMKITKRQLKRIIREATNDWYSDKHETLADRKFADSQQGAPRMSGIMDPEDPSVMADIERQKGMSDDDVWMEDNHDLINYAMMLIDDEEYGRERVEDILRHEPEQPSQEDASRIFDTAMLKL